MRRRDRTKDKAKQIRESVGERPRKTLVEFFNTGCTTLNLALSGQPYEGLPRARVTNFVGDGSSGKTLIALECAFYFLKTVKDIRSKIFPKVISPIVIYDNGEGVMDFPLANMYGQKFVDAVKWRRSKTIEQAGRGFLREAKNLKKGQSLLYVIDSWDQFKSVHESKVDDNIKEEEILAGYGGGYPKQKFSWKFFEDVCDVIEDNSIDATLIIISQTKQKIGVTFGKKKYRTGGDALNFYTHLVPWLRVVSKVEKTKHGEKKVFSIDVEVNVERSKVGLAFRKSQFRILLDYGIDNIASCALYLRAHKVTKWRGISLGRSAHDLHLFAKEVERKGLQQKLQRKVGMIWRKVEDAFLEEIDERQRRTL